MREVDTDVLSCIVNAIQAVRENDLERVVPWLAQAVGAYEQQPTAVHEPNSHMGDLLVLIRAIARAAADSGQPMEEVARLEVRAEALQRPLH